MDLGKTMEPTLIPIELWQMVFSLLDFKDQKNCRLVCKDFRDYVTSLPEFRSKNCLCLKGKISENHELYTILKDSDLKFTSLTVGRTVKLKISPAISIFFKKIAETVTYLDIRYCDKVDDDENSREYQFFVDNLNLFKNLQHLNIGNLHAWFLINLYGYYYRLKSFFLETKPTNCVWLPKIINNRPYYEWEFYHLIQGLVESHGSNSITQESAETFVRNLKILDFENGFPVDRYKEMVIDAITCNLKYLNIKKQSENFNLREVARDIEIEVSNRIDKLKVGEVYPGRWNESVRMLSFNIWNLDEMMWDNDSTYDVYAKIILQFVPNVTEFYITGDVYSNEYATKLAETHADKIVHLEVENKYIACDYPNLKHLKITKGYRALSEEEVDLIVKTCPRLKSIDLKMHDDLFLEISNFQFKNTDYLQYFTSINIKVYGHFTTSHTLSLLKNLKYLKLTLANNYDDICLLDHEPFTLESLKILVFKNEMDWYCPECFANLLKSLPNLIDFMYHNFILMNILIISWPMMKSLKKFTIESAIPRNKKGWGRLGKRLINVENLTVEKSTDLDVLDIIQKNMPLLKTVKIARKKPEEVPKQVTLESKTDTVGEASKETTGSIAKNSDSELSSDTLESSSDQSTSRKSTKEDNNLDKDVDEEDTLDSGKGDKIITRNGKQINVKYFQGWW